MFRDPTSPTEEIVHDGRTPLMLEVKHGMRLVEMLVDAGASVTVASATTNSTELQCAISSAFSRNVIAIEDLPEVLRLISAGLVA